MTKVRQELPARLGAEPREKGAGSDDSGREIHVSGGQIWTLKIGATVGLLKSVPHPERMMGSSRRESQEQPDSGGFVLNTFPVREESPGILYLP